MDQNKKAWKFSEEEKKTIIDLWKNGLSNVSIARKFNCDDEAIRQMIKKRVPKEEYSQIVSEHMKKFYEVNEVHKINIPRMSRKLAWWIGVIKGDGYVHEKDYYIKLEVKDKDFRDKWAKIGSDVFEIEPKLHERKIKSNFYYSASFNSKLIVLYLKENFGLFGKYKWNVPMKIKKSERKIKFGFLSGLFDAEGSFKSNLSVTLVSVNKEAVKDLKKILDEIGIESRTRIEKRTNRINSYAIISISSFKNLLMFAEEINFTIYRKRERLFDYITKMGMSGYNV